MSADWSVEFSPAAERDLRRLPVDVRERVLLSLERLAAGAFNLDVRKLEGHSDESRL